MEAVALAPWFASVLWGPHDLGGTLRFVPKLDDAATQASPVLSSSHTRETTDSNITRSAKRKASHRLGRGGAATS
jgi:hypothetical protein